jgi:hypothetical protein
VLRGEAWRARRGWAGLVGPVVVSGAVLDQDAAEQWDGLAAAPRVDGELAADAAQWARRVSVTDRDLAAVEPDAAEAEWANPEQHWGQAMPHRGTRTLMGREPPHA